MVRHMSAGIQGSVNSGFAKCLEDLADKPRMKERFAAGKRDTASRLLVELFFFQHFTCNFIRCDRNSVFSKRTSEADLRASPADLAVAEIYHMFSINELMNTLRACLGASPTLNAKPLMEKQLRAQRDAFRIVAPKAMQRTPFQEDRIAGAGTVVDGQAADVRHCFNMNHNTLIMRLHQ